MSLTVPAGGIFALLGRNGAGKSTFVKMLMGLIRPTAGEATVLGLRPGELALRRQVGFLPENFAYPQWCTGIEVLELHAGLAGMPPVRRRGRIASVLDQVGLAPDGRRLVRGYSKGMQQRLGLACALLADPPLLFLDEPTSALDPLGRREVRSLLLSLRAQGKTVFLNSHLLGEVELVADAVAVLRRGRLVAAGPLHELLDRSLEVRVRLAAGDLAGRRAACAFAPVLSETAVDPRYVRLALAVQRREDVPEVAAAIIAAGGRLEGLEVSARSLEDLFVQLVADAPSPEAPAGASGEDRG